MIRKLSLWRLGPALLVMAATACSAIVARADDPEQLSPLRFRRVYVPADRFDDWDRRLEYVPVDADAFERLVKLAGSASSTEPTPSVSHIESAQYLVRLLDENEIAGTAEWEVPHRAEGPTMMSLEPCGLAIHEAIWVEQGESAVLGVNDEGRMELLVERPGTLHLDFSLRGHPVAARGRFFDFSLPRSPRNSVEILVPPDITVSTSRGSLVEVDATGENKRQRLDLGGQHRFQLQFTRTDQEGSLGGLVIAQTTTTYDLSRRGVEVATQLTLDVQQQAITRLALSLSPGLRLVSARLGAKAAPCTIVTKGGEESNDVELVLPEPLIGTGKLLQLSALAPVVMGTPWKLPTIRPEGVWWQEGRATLLLPASMSLQQLETFGCRVSGASRRPGPSLGESIDLQCYQPDHAMTMVLAETSELVQVETGTAIRLSGGETVGSVVAALRATARATFSLDSEISPQWTIDSVTSDPAEAVLDWDVELKEFPRRTLHIQLAEALSPNNPIRLFVVGRRLRSPLGETLGLSELQIVDFLGSTSNERLFEVTADGPYQIKLSGDENLVRLDPHRLEAGLTELFLTPPTGLLFRASAEARSVAVSLERQAAQFTADVRVDVETAGEQLREAYILRCTSELAGVERLLVRFSHARAQPLRWMLADGREIAAVRLAESPTGDADGETWELSLPASLGEELELHAARSSSLAGRMSVSLAAVPAATSQSGIVTVRTNGDASIDLTDTRLDPLPQPDPTGDAPDRIRAMFRYVPARDLTTVPDAALHVARLDASAALPQAVVWDLRLSTGVLPSRAAQHRAVVRVQNEGRASITLQLPADAILQGLALDGLLVPQLLDDHQRLFLPLPQGARFPTIAIDFSTPQEGVLAAQSLSRPLLEADVPILFHQWTVWLPPGYEMWSDQDGWRPSQNGRLTWRQRLVGLLCGAPNQVRREALATVAPTSGAGSAALNQPLRGIVDRFLADVGQAAAQADAEGAAQRETWKTFLVRAAEEMRGSGAILWVDQQALQEVGVSPASEVSSAAGETPLERGAALLDQWGLALLAANDTLLLTIAGGVIQESPPWAEEYGRTVGRLPATLASEISTTHADSDSQRYVLPSAWNSDHASPWLPTILQSLTPAELNGWSAFRRAGAAPSALRIRVVERSLILWLSWGAFVLALAVGWHRPAAVLGTRLVLCGGLAATALLAPLGVVPVVSGAFWGTMLGVVRGLWALRRPVARSSEADQPNSSRQRMAIVAGSVLLCLFVRRDLFSAIAMAQEEADSTSPKMVTHVVLIPLADPDDEQPLRYYLVPKDFLRLLKQAADAASRRPRGWLIERSNYRAELQWEPAQRRIVVGSWKASLDLRVFSADTLVQIPLGDGGGVRPDHALLEGAATPLDWSEDGQSISVHVRERGVYRLEVSLRPRPDGESPRRGLRLRIPPTPRASLELLTPADAGAPEIASSIGMVSNAESNGSLQAWLGPTDQIAIHWPVESPAADAPAVFDAESLFWLKLQPGSVTLDARVKFELAQGGLRQLRFHVDPRWRLLPQPEADWSALQISGPTGDADVLELTLASTEMERIVIPLRLMLAGSSGLGCFRLPRIEPLGARSVQRFLAMTVETETLDRHETGDSPESLAPADFMARWGAGDAIPQVAFKLPEGDLDWGLLTTPRAPLLHVTASQSLGFALGRVQVRYDAVLARASSPIFQYRILAPQDLAVDSVVVREQGVARPARWSRNDTGLTVFPLGPSGVEQQLEIEGWLPIPTEGQIPLPKLDLVGADAGTTRIHVFRRPAVTVTLQDQQGLTEVTDATAAERANQETGRLVGSYEAQQPNYSASLKFRPNSPRLSGDQVTTFEREERGNWIAEVHCRLHVSQGALDEVRWQLPRNWSGPFQIDPPMSHQLLDVPGEDHRVLALRPRDPIKESLHLRVRGPWHVGAGARVSAPWIRLLGVADVEQILVLPRQLALQPVDWDVRGMVATELPKQLPAGKFTPLAFTAYRVVGESPETVMRQFESDAGVPSVRLADWAVSAQADGHYLGVVRFDVLPSGAAVFPFAAPAGCEIIMVRVAGSTAPAVLSGPRAWRVLLASNQLPQQVEVLFAGTAERSANGEAWTLHLPHPDGWSVERTLVSCAAPASARLHLRESAANQTRRELGLSRLRGAISLLRESMDIQHDFADESILAQWRRPWMRRLESDWTQLRMSDAARPLENDLRGVETSLAQVAEQLQADWPLAEPVSRTELGMREIWQVQCLEQGSVRRWAATGDGGLPIVVALGDPDARDRLIRLALAVSLVGGALLAGSLLKRRNAWPWVAHWLPAWGLAVGILWSIWLTPSLIGFVLAGVSLWLAYRQRIWNSARPAERPSA